MFPTPFAVCEHCTDELRGYESGHDDYGFDALLNVLADQWENGYRMVPTVLSYGQHESPCELCGNMGPGERYRADRVEITDDVLTVADSYPALLADRLAMQQDYRAYLTSCYSLTPFPALPMSIGQWANHGRPLVVAP